MKKSLIALAAVACLGFSGAARAGVDPYIGEIGTFAGNFCPTNYVPAQGQILPISQYTALFSILGTTYGGNGTSNFELPYLKPVLTETRAPLTQCIAIYGVFPSRN